ncbi:hypothetical protein B0H14DRAFT_3496745 [Mycena olivaceomarginata]|nr:hypothetical protein B0H14DRAFT_3496745 [Mycena olivaceomarginata]
MAIPPSSVHRLLTAGYRGPQTAFTSYLRLFSTFSADIDLPTAPLPRTLPAWVPHRTSLSSRAPYALRIITGHDNPCEVYRSWPPSPRVNLVPCTLVSPASALPDPAAIQP